MPAHPGISKEGFVIGSKTIISLLLGFLVLLDIVLFTLALFYPQTWFDLFHGQPYVDPQGLLRRTGGVWVAFTLLQFVALVKWKQQPYWLAVIAGVRLTEMFSDWVYLYFAQDITLFGRIGLFISPLANMAFGWFLIKSYLKINGGK